MKMKPRYSLFDCTVTISRKQRYLIMSSPGGHLRLSLEALSAYVMKRHREPVAA